MTREAAIKIVQSATVWTDEERDALSMLIPELAESEDEKIRKWLIAEIKATHDYDSPTSAKCVDDALAWLEKQKAQKPVEIHVDNPNIEKFDPDVKITTSDSSADGKELLYVCNKSYDIGFRDGVASVKPAGWSEEDERIRKAILGFVEPDKGGTKYSSYAELVEWSNWLKSLRPSWKPSEEQMKAMSYFVRKHQATANRATTKWPEFEAFKSLYNDLKKLL